MNKISLSILLLASLCFTKLQSQTVSTFDSLQLAQDSFWNGSASPLGSSFKSGNAIFSNYYDTSYGGFWSDGWAYSNMTDSTSPGFNNLFSAKPGKGFANSANYAIGQQNAIIRLSGKALGKVVSGFYITNSTYAYYSMRDGDFISKKFGGDTGTDKDYFKLKIQKYYGGALSNDSVVFYLADFRSADSTKDYIVNNWRWVDLTSLGNVDSLTFKLSSSDNGQFGMNTPAFFCMDNFTTRNYGLNIHTSGNTSSISVYPNPANEYLTIELNTIPAQINITDIQGKVLKTLTTNSNRTMVNISELPSGVYFLNTSDNFNITSKMFIKQ